MKIIATSDLHGDLPDIPECDLLLIAGDVCPLDSHDPHVQLNWLKGHFRPWLERQPVTDIVWVAGNHDFGCESSTGWDHIARNFPGTYLIDKAVEVQGKVIYGFPWTPNLSHLAFYAREKAWQYIAEDIPYDTDILLMHAPPAGIVTGRSHPLQWAAPHPLLKEIVLRVKPELCIFGHIHEGFGEDKVRDVKFVNVSYKDEFYDPVNGLVEITLGQTEGDIQVVQGSLQASP